MSDAERDLLALFKARSFKTGTFTLASGATSTYYIDGRMTAVHAAGAYLIGRVLFEHTRDLAIDAIGGLAVGAVPLTTATVMHYHMNGRTIEGFWVRDKVKEHGAKKLVEGGVKPGDKVLVLDDVITTGGSSVKAVDAVREMGCEVVRVLALVDRLQGAAETFLAAGIEYRSVFTIRDFGVRQPGEPATS